MQKAQAKKLVLSDTVTVGQLREYALHYALDKEGEMCGLNPVLTADQFVDISLAAFADCKSDEHIVGEAYCRSRQRTMMTNHGLIAWNILRECA